MLTLYPYQEDALAWIRSTVDAHGTALLADDMGVGKSPPLFCAPPDGAPIISVVPGNLKPQTAERLVTWRGPHDVSTVEGVGSFRAPKRGQSVVLNPELLPGMRAEGERLERELAEADAVADGLLFDASKERDEKQRAAIQGRLDRLAKRGILHDVVIERGTWLLIDEAHEFNAWRAAQTERLRGLVAAVLRAGGRVVGATATPLLNDPGDLRGLLSTLRLGGRAWPAATGRALNNFAFLRDWGGAKGQFGEEWHGAPREDRCVAALQRVMLRRNFADACPEVPRPRPHRAIHVSLDDAARRLADEADKRILERMSDLIAGRDDAVAFERVAKLRAAMAVASIPAIEDWCSEMESAREPAVVSCVAVETVRRIGQRDGWATIDGQVTGAARHRILQRFAAGELRGVAMTIAAGGVGTDMQRAAEMLFASREWNPAKNHQAFARIYRRGQPRAPRATILRMDHPLADRIDELLLGRRRYMRVIAACARPARRVA